MTGEKPMSRIDDLLADLRELHGTMTELGANRAGLLQHAEAALFHNAAQLVSDLVDILHDRINPDED